MPNYAAGRRTALASRCSSGAPLSSRSSWLLPLPFVFIAAALIGLTMPVTHFRGKTSPVATGWLHGVFIIAAMLMFLSMLVSGNGDAASVAASADPNTRSTEVGWGIFGLFGLAALGGLFLFFRQKRAKPWPALVILAHGGVAIAAIVLLLGWRT